MKYQKITNFLVTRTDEIPRFITKKSVEVHDQSVVLMTDINQTNK